MNKKERRLSLLERHYKSLELLAMLISGAEINGKKASTQLRRIEAQAHRMAETMCSEEIAEQYIENNKRTVIENVKQVLGALPEGFILNRDPRGYSLKIDDEIMRTKYSELGLFRDMGGYGLLAPEINGDF